MLVRTVGTPRCQPATLVIPPWWPLAAITVGFPVWWALGLSAMAWPLVSVAVLLPRQIMAPGHVRFPPGFAAWMLFMVWVLLSATQLQRPDQAFSFGYRGSVYVAATIIFLYVYNETEERLPTRRVLGFLVGMWIAVAIGGHIGAVFPRANFTSPTELLLPQSVLNNQLVHALVHPRFAQASSLFGRDFGRPHALFPWTNGWGSTWGILFPIVMCWLGLRTTSAVSKLAVIGVFVLSLYSVTISLNRGLWISIVVALVYATFRFACQLRLIPILLAIFAGLIVVLAVTVTPLSDVVSDRSEGGHSDEGRSSLYTQSMEISVERPVLGWGTTQPRNDKEGGPSVGTHGHVWLVLVSQGIVGLALYVTWWGYVLVTTLRQRNQRDVWLHAVFIVMLVQSFIYEHNPVQLPIGMIIAGLLLRQKRLAAEGAAATELAACLAADTEVPSSFADCNRGYTPRKGVYESRHHDAGQRQ